MAGPGSAQGAAGFLEEGVLPATRGAEKLRLFFSQKRLPAKQAGDGKEEVNEAPNHGNNPLAPFRRVHFDL
jgi:hypothetical protein